MASPNNPASVEQLIRKHSKARVVKAAPVPWLDARRGRIREICNADVIESMVRKYA